MNLYLISQTVNNGCDTYDSAVVSAKSIKDAKEIHPSEFVTHIANGKWMGTFSGGPNIGLEYENESSGWVSFSDIDCIDVKYLGKTRRKRGVILASYFAG